MERRGPPTFWRPGNVGGPEVPVFRSMDSPFCTEPRVGIWTSNASQPSAQALGSCFGVWMAPSALGPVGRRSLINPVDSPTPLTALERLEIIDVISSAVSY